MYNLLTTENVLFFLFSTIFWPSTFYCMSFCHSNLKIVKNVTHFFHAILFIFLYKIVDHSIIDYPIILSFGFYFCDLFYILHNIVIKTEKFIRRLPYLVHHFITNYALYIALNNYCREQILYIFYILEYSNLVLYIGYHIQKQYSTYKNLILVVQCFQFVWYTYFRVIRFVIYMFNIFAIFYNVYLSIQLVAIILFLMGVTWSWKIFQKCLFFLKIETLDSDKLD